MTDSNMLQFTIPPSVSFCKDVAWDSSGHLVVDQNGLIVLSNPKADDTFGEIRGGLVNKRVEQLMPEESAAKHPGLRAVFMAASPANHAMNFGREVLAKRLDGVSIRVLVALTPFRDERGAYFVMAKIDQL